MKGNLIQSQLDIFIVVVLAEEKGYYRIACLEELLVQLPYWKGNCFSYATEVHVVIEKCVKVKRGSGCLW